MLNKTTRILFLTFLFAFSIPHASASERELIKLARSGPEQEVIKKLREAAVAGNPEWIRTPLHWFSINPTLTEAGVKEVFAFAAELEKKYATEFGELDGLTLSIAENYWRDQPASRTYIDRFTEPMVINRLEWSPVAIPGETQTVEEKSNSLVTLPHLLARQTRMFQDIHDSKRLQFIELLFSRITESDLLESLYSGLSESDAVKEAGGIDRFIELLKTLSPKLYPRVNRLSWVDTMKVSADNLDRGFGGAGRKFLSGLIQVFQIGTNQDFETAIKLLNEKIKQAMTGSSWADIRGLPNLVTDLDLVKAIESAIPKLPPKLKSAAEKLLADIKGVNESKTQLRDKAKDEVRKCADNIFKIIQRQVDKEK